MLQTTQKRKDRLEQIRNRSDAEALASDWVKVGQDIQKAMNVFEKEEEKQDE